MSTCDEVLQLLLFGSSKISKACRSSCCRYVSCRRLRRKLTWCVVFNVFVVVEELVHKTALYGDLHSFANLLEPKRSNCRTSSYIDVLFNVFYAACPCAVATAKRSNCKTNSAALACVGCSVAQTKPCFRNNCSELAPSGAYVCQCLHRALTC